MSHELDLRADGTAAMAYVGALPWHSLGQALTPDASIETWRTQAGLDFDVLSAEVKYQTSELRTFADRNVLYRSDTGQPLSIVSNRYNVVQPGQVLDFFKELVDTAGFTLETAGVLYGGKKVWALAKVNEGADVIGHDTVRPYILLATSFDATLATTAKFTAVRVVCNNTLSISVANEEGRSVKIAHSKKFDASAVRQQLGVAVNSFERFMINSRLLANRPLARAEAEALTFKLIEPTLVVPKGKTEKDVLGSHNYKRIMQLFSGDSMGYDMVGDTSWGWLNSVTELVDHERGKNPSSRMNSAWFGSGDTLKTRALEMAMMA